MILVVDVGNTRIKGAVFENNNMLSNFVFPKNEIAENIKKFLSDFPEISHVVVSVVGFLDKEAFEAIENLKIHFVSHHDNFPFVNKYATPLTLGIDRMVLSAGAVLAFPGQNRLVIDAGTCVTYDFVDKNDYYLGGAISPGLRLRYGSLHNYTEKLPLLDRKNPEHFIGQSTNEAIHSGVINGLAHEIDGFIDQYRQQYSNFTIILTGGDAEFLAKRLKNTIFANSNFLLESLNHLYHTQINND